MLVLIAILALSFLVLVHEAGHFLAARACGMQVQVFSVGFGPPLISFHGTKTEYRLSLIPLGGYVRIAGMLQGEKEADNPAAYASRPAWQRLLVVAAGPVINWFFALLLLIGLYSHGYRVVTGQPIIEEIIGRPAATAGLMPGDQVLAVDEVPITSWAELMRALSAGQNRSLSLRILRRDTQLSLTARLDAHGRLGITAQSRLERYPLGESVSLAFRKSGELVGYTLSGLRELFRGTGKAQLMGPVKIVTETAEAARDALSLIFMLVQISLGLALMNLLPLPALDGGRLLFIVVALIRRRPVNASVEAVVHLVGLLTLLSLIAFISIKEVRNLFKTAPPAAKTAPSTNQ